MMPVFACLGQLELLGQSIYDFIHPCDQEELTDLLTPRPGQMRRLFPNQIYLHSLAEDFNF